MLADQKQHSFLYHLFRLLLGARGDDAVEVGGGDRGECGGEGGRMDGEDGGESGGGCDWGDRGDGGGEKEGGDVEHRGGENGRASAFRSFISFLQTVMFTVIKPDSFHMTNCRRYKL